jgi:hypothetical protein
MGIFRDFVGALGAVFADRVSTKKNEGQKESARPRRLESLDNDADMLIAREEARERAAEVNREIRIARLYRDE